MTQVSLFTCDRCGREKQNSIAGYPAGWMSVRLQTPSQSQGGITNLDYCDMGCAGSIKALLAERGSEHRKGAA